MAKIDFNKVPKFSQLPVRPGAPADSNWGVFGDDDEVGCVNFLTEDGVVEAAQLVRKGRVFRLDTPVNYASPPLFDREPVQHTKKSFESLGLLGFDDVLDQYNTQEGSQWDGLGHVGNLKAQAFYNGVTNDQIKQSAKLGIHNWADRFVGRGVLIDAFRFRADKGRPVNPLNDERYSLDDLKQALAAQSTELKPGSILLVRTGWMQAYLGASPAQKREMAPINKLKACGIDDSREMVAWLWDNRVAAIGTDCPAVEPWPWDFRDNGALHYRTLSLLGLPLGEQFNLEKLAADCAGDKRYEFMLVSVPLHLVGGIASPPNAVAIK
ncbi:MAG TPA: cyclase family protein [Candidatus Binataceae bacterium]|nr:cyclase family protein [Candidatus Binataceae bacterium]